MRGTEGKIESACYEITENGRLGLQPVIIHGATLCRRRAGVQPGFEGVVGAPQFARPRPRNQTNFLEDEEERLRRFWTAVAERSGDTAFRWRSPFP